MSPMSEKATYFAAGAVVISCLSLLYNLVISNPLTPRNHRSPLHTTIPNLTPTDLETLAYPPTSPLLPNPRDIPTPYGSIRTYTFGPASAPRKIVFLHGISTPCISLSLIAKALARKGCRVLLLDLFGRGYSDGPDPRDVRYDGGLYAAQVMMALVGSEDTAGWMSEGFTLVGYSLGGGLAADFASWWPASVRDLVLLAPGGLIRTTHVGWKSKALYSVGLFPEAGLSWIVKRRMRGQLRPTRVPNPSRSISASDSSEDGITRDVDDAVRAEIGRSKSSESAQNVDAEGAVAWQLEHHPGFISSFMSSLRYAPIHDQHARWGVIGERLRIAEASKTTSSLKSGAVLIILGATDPIIVREEIEDDATATLGEGNVEFRVLEDAGHEFPMTHAEQTAEYMWHFWVERDGGRP